MPDTTTDLIAAAAQNALDARNLEQERLDGVSLRLEAVTSDYLDARREAEAARSHLRGLLTRYAPGHTVLAFPGLLSDTAEHGSREVENDLTACGLDVSAALAPDVLDAWRFGGRMPPAEEG
jgi:hypothetical protein